MKEIEMRRVFVFALFAAVLLFSSNLVAQPTDNYSESAAYTPRVFPQVKGKSEKEKKKVDGGPSIVSSPVPTKPVSQNMTIPVMVYTNSASLVPGLRSADFKAFVDDAEVEVVSVETREAPLTIVIALDMSPSANEQIKAVKALASRIVDRLRATDKVMVVGFNADMKIATEPTIDRKLIAKAIDRLSMGNGTSVYNTVSELFEKRFNSITEPTALFLISDGVDTTSRKASYATSLAAAEMGNIPVFPIYLDTVLSAASAGQYPTVFGIQLPPARGSTKEEYELGRYYLTDLLRLSGGRAFLADEVLSGKSEALDRLPADLASRYYVTIRLPKSGEAKRSNRLKIRINIPNVSVLAKGSYVGN